MVIMDILYLDVFHSEKQSTCSVETFIITCIYNHCIPEKVTIVFVVDSESSDDIPLDVENFKFTKNRRCDLPWTIRSCKLPALISENYVITGLCGVARHIVKCRTTRSHGDEHPEGLLGFRSSCLQAPGEVSVWTNFCEREIVETAKFIIHNEISGMLNIPVSLLKFENHLKQPSRIHNAYKVARELASLESKPFETKFEESAKLDVSNSVKPTEVVSIKVEHKNRICKNRKWKSSSNCQNEHVKKCTELDKSLSHCFSEGPYMTLADVILFTCYSLIFNILNYSTIANILPKSATWFERIKNDEYFEKVNRMTEYAMNFLMSKRDVIDVEYSLPEMECVSLYKHDPKRHNSKKREFTKDPTVVSALSCVNEDNIISIKENIFVKENEINWSTIPSDVNPFGGHLPDLRKERKSQQLANLAQCVLKIAKDGHKIIDFCCGGGHLGILLAYLLPNSIVILLENKEESLKRAVARIKRLALNNIYLFQCNIDYFIGDFDIGVALHACGVATDIVLGKCIRQKASFVACPCCYGSLHATEKIKYPLSKLYSNIPLDKYLSISHGADQTHTDHPLEARGTHCMNIIDSDRLHRAKEHGYQVYLTRLHPLNCSPKNMLLMGNIK